MPVFIQRGSAQPVPGSDLKSGIIVIGAGARVPPVESWHFANAGTRWQRIACRYSRCPPRHRSGTLKLVLVVGNGGRLRAGIKRTEDIPGIGRKAQRGVPLLVYHQHSVITGTEQQLPVPAFFWVKPLGDISD